MRKNTLRIAAVTTPIAALAAGGIIYAMPDKKPTAQLATQQASSVQAENHQTTEPTQAPAQAVQVQETEPEPTPTPVETVDSIVATQGWNEQQLACVTKVRELKADYFTPLDKAKHTVKAIRYFNNPCVLLTQNSTGQIIDQRYWRMVENFPN